MNYIQGNLRPGEKIVIEAKKSAVALIPNIVISVLILIIGIAAEVGLYALLAVLIYMIFVVVIFLSAELCVTDKKIIGKTGVINIKSLDAFLDRIDNISLSQSFWGRVFNYSTISVSTVSGHYNFLFISDPLKFKHITMDQMEIFEELRMRKQAEITRDINNGTYKAPVNNNNYQNNNYNSGYNQNQRSEGYQQPVNGYNSAPANRSYNPEINVCPKCGAEYGKNSKFCQRCGQPR